jgi:FkbM family methyltransferase
MVSSESWPFYLKHGNEWLLGRQPMIVEVNGSRMLARPRSYDLYVLGEVFREEVYAPRLSVGWKPRLIMDLGANIGSFSVWAARRWPTAKILAVEMESENFSLLQENIGLNALDERIAAVQAAVWSSSGSVRIKRDRLNAGGHSASSDADGDEVRAVTLGTLLQTVGGRAIDLLKMDIEGAEAALFNESNAKIFSKVGYLTVEVHPGVAVKSIAGYLEAMGFAVILRRQWFRSAQMLEAINQTLPGAHTSAAPALFSDDDFAAIGSGVFEAE